MNTISGRVVDELSNGERDTRRIFWFWAILFISALILALVTDVFYIGFIPFGFLLFYLGWQSLSIPFFLLMVSIPFSMEYQVNPSLGTDIPDEMLMVITTILFALHWAWRPGLLSRKLIAHPILVVILVGLLWSVVTAITSVNGPISFKYILAKSWYLGSFTGAALILFQKPAYLKISAWLLALSLLAVTVIVFVSHAQTGFTFASINDALKPYFRNHVNYSALLVCIFPLLYVYWFFANSQGKKALIVILVGAVLAALILTYARGAWLALVIGMLAWWLIRRKALLKVYIVSILVLSGVFFYLSSGNRYLEYAHDYRTTVFHEDFKEHLVATYKLKDVSTAERFYRWIAGVKMVGEKPVTGFGPNTFYGNYKSYAIPAFKTWVSNNPEHSTVHNYFLLIAIEQGLPGLLIFLILCGLMFYFAEKVYHGVATRLWRNVGIVAGSILAMVLTVNFLSDLIETDKIGSVFYLCLSALVVADTRGEE